MSDFTAYDITELMIQYGGGFVSGLGRLYRAADASNQAKLLAAFPEYFAQYREMAARGERPERPPPQDGQTHEMVASDSTRPSDSRVVCGVDVARVAFRKGFAAGRHQAQQIADNHCSYDEEWYWHRRTEPLGSPTP